MSGHSKWANIKNKKAANDKVKGTIFAKLTRMITLSVVEGGGITNPDINFKLRLTIDKAHTANMPNDTIQRAIEKGHSPDSSKLKEVVYEAFGPHGVVYMIQCATDNPTRSHNEVRGVVEKKGGKMGSLGSVGYLFQKCAVMQFDLINSSEDMIFEFGQSLQAYDIDEKGGTATVYFPFDQFGKVKAALGTSLHPKRFDVEYRPLSRISVPSEREAKHIIELTEAIEELVDVHSVFNNLE